MIQRYARLCQFYRNFGKSLSRNLKTKAEKEETNKGVKYTSSINLPKTKFPARLNATQRAQVEEHIRDVSR